MEGMSKEALYVDNMMRTAKSSVGSYELPCGYLVDGVLHTSVTVREITGYEEDIMASGQMPGVKKVTEVLSRCVTSIGPYSTGLREVVLDLPVGDRVYLMFAVRRATVGDEFPFTAKCPACAKESFYVQNLGELDVKGMKDPMQRFFDLELPKSGFKARFKVMTGRDEEKIAKFSNTADEQSLALLVRLEQLDGKPPTMGDVKSLSMADRSFLREQMLEIEGGIDTEVQITCPSCEEEFPYVLDIRQEGFFFPSQVQKRLRRKSST